MTMTDHNQLSAVTVDLKPCPFCGGKADFNNDRDYWFQVICSGCGCRGTEYPNNREKAAIAWNRRAPPEPPLERCIK